METTTATQNPNWIADIMDYADQIIVAGGMSPASWKRMKRLCKLVGITVDDAIEAAR